MRPYEYIKARQIRWARRRGITLDKAGYVEELNDNLFLPPTDELLRELPQNRDRAPHRSIFAAHSSTALVANVFSYWRLYNNLRPIISIISPGLVNYEPRGLTFEAQCPIAWPVPQPDRQPPHLDLVIRYRDEAEPSVIKAIGVESKFGELYGQNQGDFVDCYVAPENECIWEGCEPLRDLAIRINGGERRIFRRLKVAQLIKHILGMKSQFGGSENFELIYMWYPVPGPRAVEHEREIRAFQDLIDSCQPRINFRAIGYPDVIDSLARDQDKAHGAYINYLTERYF